MTLLARHISFLEQRMKSISHLPTAFEYYSAIHMTYFHHTPFYVYQDIPMSYKLQHGFPIQDKGVDIANNTFTHIGQAKYYREGNIIHYGRLATFLATPLLVGKKDIKLTLIHTHECTLHEEIKQIISRGDLTNFPLCSAAFLARRRTL